jgi:ATP-dependent RNA helicase RhlE
MTFSDLNLSKPLLSALSDQGITNPTTIQKKVFSEVMAGKDVCGIAQTGTGKTYAYLLPCLRQIEYSKDRNPQLLIIVPTRELVIQVLEEVKKLTKYMSLVAVGVYGGVNLRPQAELVNQGSDILVGTPGRIVDLFNTGILRGKSIKKLVIDEFDEMLNLGLRTQLRSIFDRLPERRQNLLFSSTLNPEVEQLIEAYFINLVRIEATPIGTPLENISQTCYPVPNFHTKVNFTKLLLSKNADMSKVLIFTATKHLADLVYAQLAETFMGSVNVIHSNKSQNQRFNAVNEFQSGACRVLIATDIIARGIDVAEVTHVINFDMPTPAETYIHRIGRTGRKERKGIAISFMVEKEKENLDAIELLMNYRIPFLELPDEVEISELNIPEEEPIIKMKSVKVKKFMKDSAGPAFHAKSAKNSKVNVRRDRAAEMKLKYGKNYRKKR